MGKPLIEWTEAGLYCEAGRFWIDPHRAVPLAVITHGHSDHARRGSAHYLCTPETTGILRIRLGRRISVEGIPYRQPFRLGHVTVSFHSAGHILGSAQVRVEHAGEVWVASGDYKRDSDPSCTPFDPVRCDTFITEATFGTPSFQWDKGRPHGQEIIAWHRDNQKTGQNSLLFGYSLGKTQRILAELKPFVGEPIWIHRSMAEITQWYREAGIALAPTRVLPEDLSTFEEHGALLLAPPGTTRELSLDRQHRFATAFASGWMQSSQKSPQPFRYEKGFVLSDHADWNDLNQTIRETGASRVFVQHRAEGALVRHLRSTGIQAFSSDDLDRDRFARLPDFNLSLFGALAP